MQLVPAARGCTIDQVPLAHCWNDVAPMQFHSPSVVQAPVRADPEPVVPVLAGVDGEVAELGWEEATGDGAGVLAVVGEAEVARVVAAWEPAGRGEDATGGCGGWGSRCDGG